MARFYGKIGYAIAMETAPGVYSEEDVERCYYGDVIRHSSRWETSGNVNDNISFNNEISIVADPFAFENFQFMRYVEYMGVKWKITSIEVQRPRLILAIGGVYNGQQA